MSELSIIDVREATPQEWDDIWRECPYSTYSQSREWFEIWARWYRGRLTATPRIYAFSDGRKALVPLAELVCHHGLVTERTVSPGDGYGGWLSPDRLNRAHASRLCEQLMRLTNLRWRLNPHDPLLGAVNVPVTLEEEAEVVDLRGARAPASRGAEDCEVVLATTAVQWRAYHRMRRASGISWANRRDWRLLDSMYTKGSTNVRLWLAQRADVPLAGGVFLLANAHCQLWDIAVSRGLSDLGPLEGVLDAAMLDARARGDVPFDLDGVGDAAIAELARLRGSCRVLRGGRVESASPATRIVRQLSAIKRAALGSPGSSVG